MILWNKIWIFRCQEIDLAKIDFLVALNESICNINITPELETMEKEIRESRLFSAASETFPGDRRMEAKRKTLSESQVVVALKA